MNHGGLQIPKVEIKPFADVNDFQTRIYLQYIKIVENSEEGKAIVGELTKDQRVTALSNKMISTGSGAVRFEIKTLAMWFLWCVNEFGQETAKDFLDSFLDSDEVEVTNTLWVLGIEVDEPIELDHGYTIQSTESMSDSTDKEHFQQHRLGNTPHLAPAPAAAITKSCRVKKISSDDHSAKEGDDADFWITGRRLHELSLLLNALNGVSCLPFYATSYPRPETPLGPFGGRGGGFSLYDVMGHSSTKLTLDDRALINTLAQQYDAHDKPEKQRIQTILSRLSQAKRREEIADKILDLCIALEMLLLQGNDKDQLSLSFRLRGSWLLGTSPMNRVEIYAQLKKLYGYRSNVAHTGVLCGGKVAKIQAVRRELRDYESLAERICRKVIEDGKPDWDKVVLHAR